MSSVRVVAVDSCNCEVLKTPTQPIGPNEFNQAAEIGQKLFEGLKPYMPAAGLAAPQIGIGRSVFIYSYDRKPENLEVAVNPSFEPISNERVEGWEACLSMLESKDTWQLAKLKRFEKIHVVYWNIKGEKVEKDLIGFGAKVFQHEYDHLQGIVNIYHPNAEVKSFPSKAELQTFMAEVKKEDAKSYKAPS